MRGVFNLKNILKYKIQPHLFFRISFTSLKERSVNSSTVEENYSSQS